MVILRGHHLICLHFFNGEGYDKVFIDNLRDILKRIDKEEIKITHGPDDVCKCCPHLKDNICHYDKDAEEEVREMDNEALQLLNIDKDSVHWGEIKNKLPLIFSQWHDRSCLDCVWLKVCNENKFFKSLKEV